MTTLSTPTSNIMNHHNSTSIFISPGEQTATAIRGLCFLLGISGNIAVVVFLLRHFKRDNFTLQLMLNLAASDILSLLTLPVWMYSFLLGWTMGLASCKFFYFIAYTGIHVSVLTVTLMSVYRYVLVLHRSQWTKLGQRGERALFAGVWVLAGVLAISPVITVNIIEDEGKLHCEQVVRSEGEKVGVLLLEIMLLYVTPLTILMTSYLCLHRKVSDRALSNFRLGKLVTCIIVTFIICSTPYTVVSVMMMATPSQPVLVVRRLAYRGPRRAVQSIVFLNSCVNPFLYAFNFRSVRKEADKNVTETSNNVKDSSQTIATLS
ncbi:G-protein coupled receptor 15-like [Alosa sapidissima]|uniref:G-protein coupled receptor 15-like n=1 Tax=Alosa sapidissima TaxID=34773 RepID=UPI001C080C47|nr:G-protein coupled receptor 15-like [Alosa sapidissima]